MSLIRKSLEEQQEMIATELVRAREEASTANERVARLEREHRALSSAIDIMDGKEPEPIAQKFEFPSIPPVHVPRPSAWTPATPPPDGAKYVEFNGERILLEPGWRVGKNSFGEDVLLPEGAPDPEPMPEPVIPMAPPPLIPMLGSGDSFAPDMPTPGGEEDIPF